MSRNRQIVLSVRLRRRRLPHEVRELRLDLLQPFLGALEPQSRIPSIPSDNANNTYETAEELFLRSRTVTLTARDEAD